MPMQERMRLAKKGQAMPDGSFPIPDLDHLKRAIRAYGRSSDPSATRKWIIQRAEALGHKDLIPAHWM